MLEYDYIIAGAGPAGAVAAYCLQRKGFKCLIVEKRNKIDEKICGGLLSGEAVAALSHIELNAMELIDFGATKINSFTRIKNGTPDVYCYPYGEYCLGLRRNYFDQWLLDKAVTYGADVMMGVNLKNVVEDKSLFFLQDIYAKHLIIATGAANCFGADRSLYDKQSIGISAQITGSTNLLYNSAYFFFIDNGYDYVWAIPNGENIWNIGIWLQKFQHNVMEKFNLYYHLILEKHFTDVTFIRPAHGALCGNTKVTYYPSVDCNYIGDAAGTNDHNTGEGLRQAIESAIYLSEKLW